MDSERMIVCVLQEQVDDNFGGVRVVAFVDQMFVFSTKMNELYAKDKNLENVFNNRITSNG